ncbi:hypothetical protein [Herbaspirillum sp. NPDC101397]|uniref:hypothetical protein n=1 Tax=Herbaspirillum sp. NPDC101397 TaxID=3364006 RepID=UPI00383A4EA0
MFAESMILHAITECEARSERSHNQQANHTGKENHMAAIDEKSHAGQKPPAQQSQSQNQQQGQDTPPSGRQQARSNFVDPLGRPIYQGTPRFTDQQAGGDLTGDESDARDDNYLETGSGQNARDVSAHASELTPVSTELLRSAAVAPTVRPSMPPTTTPAELVEPDGTEDPGANADDGLVPRSKDGAASEQH